MPSGRLGRCIIPGRKGIELYVNSSGKEASVTIQTQAISTTANVEQSIVVGVAASTLEETAPVATSPVGTYTSISGFNYSCWPTNSSSQTGVSTFSGAFRTPMRCYDDTNNVRHGTYEETADSHFRFVDPNTGNQTYACHMGCLCGACRDASGNNFRCCYRGMYGGNELQNPLIWLMQENPSDHPGGVYGFPRDCSCCNWFWGGQIVGWSPGNKYVFCCPYNTPCTQGGGDFWFRAPNFIGCTNSIGDATCNGVGVFKTDLAITAMQLYTNPCCCCGHSGANTWPVARWDASGCSSSNSCCGGPPCNYALCKFHHYNCCHSNVHCCSITLGFNWYSLCNSSYCCCRLTGIMSRDWVYICSRRDNSGDTPFSNMGVISGNSNINCCFPCIARNTVIPMMSMRLSWCGNCWCCNNGNPDGHIYLGYMTTCTCTNNPECGVMYFNAPQLEFGQCCCNSGGTCWWAGLRCKYYYPCSQFNTSYRARGNGSDQNWIMSPYGFDHGMTNCYWAHHKCGNNNNQHRYVVGWPDPRVAGGSCRTRCSCDQYWAKNMYLDIDGPNDIGQVGAEYPIKYVAWNPFDCYVYMAVRSSNSESCGIFRIDAHLQRQFHGPHCGRSTYHDGTENLCHNNCRSESFNLACISNSECGTTHKLEYCKIADWPACWAQNKYKNKSFCVSCLFRNQRCNWIMDVYNHTTAKWDSYSTANLHEWSLVQDSEGTDPFKLKISNTLEIQSTTNFACIVTTCNCFMANMDCSGLIDYCISANQYERNGIVLSNGDRVMINNNSDEKLNAQIWGYEG